jgi:peptide/nickel transport system substrate-binding protein
VRHSNFQLRPEHANPRALLDIRARQAVAHATDRLAMAETLTESREAVADVLLLPQVEYYVAVDRAIAKYPHDVRRAEQLLAEVGFQKSSEGLFTSPTEGRFSLEVAVAAGGRNDREVAIMADSLRSAGLDASINVIPRAQIADRQMRTRLPGILNGSHNRGAAGPPIQRLRAAELPTAANGWRGGNQTGWTDPEMERLISAFETSLDRGERADHVVDMLRLASRELPIFALYYNLSFLAHVSTIQGPGAYVSDDTAHWNLHEWSWID